MSTRSPSCSAQRSRPADESPSPRVGVMESFFSGERVTSISYQLSMKPEGRCPNLGPVTRADEVLDCMSHVADSLEVFPQSLRWLGAGSASAGPCGFHQLLGLWMTPFESRSVGGSCVWVSTLGRSCLKKVPWSRRERYLALCGSGDVRLFLTSAASGNVCPALGVACNLRRTQTRSMKHVIRLLGSGWHR